MRLIRPETYDVGRRASAYAQQCIKTYVAENMILVRHRLDFAETPVSFREFIASKNHMGATTPPLSDRQLMLADFMLGTDPEDCFENNNHLAVLVWGKGSGKGMMCALFLLYICYLLMCMKNPHDYLNHAAADWIDCINVSPSGENSDDVFFEKVKQRVLRWPWLSKKYSIKNSGAYISTVKSEGADSAGSVTITRDGIIFPKLIRLLSCNSANESAEGKNTLVFTMDEASAMKSDPKSKANIGNAYTIFNRVLMKSAKTRFARFYKGFVISFPRSENDFTMELYKANLANLHVYTDKAASWDVLPSSKFTGETFEFEGVRVPIEFKDDFELDPTEAKMTLMAEPPAVEGGTFIEYPDRIRLAMVSRPHIISSEEYVNSKSKICRRITRYADIPASQGLYVCVDLGDRKDKAVVSGFHPIYRSDQIVIVQDFIAIWRPDRSAQRTVSFINVGDFIRELSLRYAVEGVWFDQWQSIEMRERLAEGGIPTHEYNLLCPDYDAFKELLYAKRVDLISDDDQYNEMRALVKKGQRVDHTSSSEKDITDTVVGACKVLSQLNHMGGDENIFGEIEMIQENLHTDPW